MGLQIRETLKERLQFVDYERFAGSLVNAWKYSEFEVVFPTTTRGTPKTKVFCFIEIKTLFTATHFP